MSHISEELDRLVLLTFIIQIHIQIILIKESGSLILYCNCVEYSSIGSPPAECIAADEPVAVHIHIPLDQAGNENIYVYVYI